MRRGNRSGRALAKALAVLAAAAVVAAGAWHAFLYHQVNRFRQITPAMTMDEVERRLGKPGRREGSGFIFLHYRLLDGSEVRISGSRQEVSSVTREGVELMDPHLLRARDDLRRQREEHDARLRTEGTRPVLAAPGR
ncbi:MAG TPA: hypothetical protein VEB66_14065 [Opitutaceae bacterium]|nr:hypothetical protein [Opitutaceae bacterium]